MRLSCLKRPKLSLGFICAPLGFESAALQFLRTTLKAAECLFLIYTLRLQIHEFFSSSSHFGISQFGKFGKCHFGNVFSKRKQLHVSSIIGSIHFYFLLVSRKTYSIKIISNFVLSKNIKTKSKPRFLKFEPLWELLAILFIIITITKMNSGFVWSLDLSIGRFSFGLGSFFDLLNTALLQVTIVILCKTIWVSLDIKQVKRELEREYLFLSGRTFPKCFQVLPLLSKM